MQMINAREASAFQRGQDLAFPTTSILLPDDCDGNVQVGRKEGQSSAELVMMLWWSFMFSMAVKAACRQATPRYMESIFVIIMRSRLF
ncbi:MAG TPA: hypothetical protein VGV39_15325 [Mesorhizobium sp.]|uniref:hypothetical protein n=1 Tax=Mesorhizobium sp. TaxID=1871066 RepID=UPI002DDD6A46|nr:hypothetical protein [Mesorhizobium sp.]HEV2504447.1 hypothetical protein [Mesorhizobium sp.]